MKRIAFLLGVSCVFAQPARIEGLIAALRNQPWPGVAELCVPSCPAFRFTEPMKALLAIGAPAQEHLLRRLFEPAIMDQVMILLGGVGDERSIVPLIEAMKMASAEPQKERRERLLLTANFALTNITGGLAEIRHACPNDPAGCWESWWRKNRRFTVKEVRKSRPCLYFPIYGIYRNPAPERCP